MMLFNNRNTHTPSAVELNAFPFLLLRGFLSFCYGANNLIAIVYVRRTKTQQRGVPSASLKKLSTKCAPFRFICWCKDLSILFSHVQFRDQITKQKATITQEELRRLLHYRNLQFDSEWKPKAFEEPATIESLQVQELFSKISLLYHRI